MDNAWIAALLQVPGIGHERIKALVRYFDSAQLAWQADRRDLFLSGCLPDSALNELLRLREKIDPVKQWRSWQDRGILTVSINEATYPAHLRNIYNPPVLLFYRGTLPMHEQLIAIVGTRHASAYGRNVAKDLACSLATAGFTVVSGAARGIDTAAHIGALEQGLTIAVLACGVDISYPPENRNLLNKITALGAVISEYPPGTPPTPGLFPARNRIISGLSRGVIVIEAAEKSGSLITADAALDQNRDVFAVPGSIFSEQNRGCHKLIKQGAKLIDCVADILEEYNVSQPSSSNLEDKLSIEEQTVLQVLSPQKPISLEEIIMRTHLSTASLTYILLQLELRGIALKDGQNYLRSAREGIR